MSRTQLDFQKTLGLYGKIPSLGDFVVRNLKGEFVNQWDGWLQDCVANSRQVFGSAWLDKYLQAPIWRFVIGPNVLDSSAWIGIIVPSVDRVGRYFPLTLTQPIDPDIDIVATYLDNCEWFKSLEDLGMDALKLDLNFEEYEARLAGVPPATEIVDMDAGESTIPVLNKVFLSSYFILPEDGDHDYLAQISKVIAGSREPTSLWGSEWFYTKEHFLLATEKLPSKTRFCSFLDKTFEEHGWVDASKNSTTK